MESKEQLIKQLNESEICKIYKEHLIYDFPVEEQKPLELILERVKKEEYLCYAMLEEEQIVAYAFFAKAKETTCILMDYLAVCRTVRSKGYGSKFLGLLTQELKKYDGILFEVESGRSAKGKEELQVCKKRMDFYQKNGLRFTKVSTELFGVDLVVMYLVLQKELEDSVLYQAMADIYQYLYDEETRKAKVLIRLNKEIQIAKEWVSY